MNIEKALKIIDVAIENKQNKKTGLLDPNKSWNTEEYNVSEYAKGLAQVMENDIEWFKAIKKQLRSKKNN